MLLGCLTASTVSAFLKEFITESGGDVKKKAVLLTFGDPEDDLKYLLKRQPYKEMSMYIRGSLLVMPSALRDNERRLTVTRTG